MIRFFESPDQAGTDVISMNINRGRDHGIAGYMEWRKMCKLSTADQFSSLTDHTPEMVKLLQSQYRFVMKSLFFLTNKAVKRYYNLKYKKNTLK